MLENLRRKGKIVKISEKLLKLVGKSWSILLGRENFENSGKKLEMCGKKFSLSMSAKIQGVKNFDNARREDFVKIYHALEKICVAPQMPPP